MNRRRHCCVSVQRLEVGKMRKAPLRSIQVLDLYSCRPVHCCEGQVVLFRQGSTAVTPIHKTRKVSHARFLCIKANTATAVAAYHRARMGKVRREYPRGMRNTRARGVAGYRSTLEKFRATRADPAGGASQQWVEHACSRRVEIGKAHDPRHTRDRPLTTTQPQRGFTHKKQYKQHALSSVGNLHHASASSHPHSSSAFW